MGKKIYRYKKNGKVINNMQIVTAIEAITNTGFIVIDTKAPAEKLNNSNNFNETLPDQLYHQHHQQKQ